jgi:cellulose biosynthesis protein BcsQ
MDSDLAVRDGTICTFYSYKGGVGRTMALANVGWLLADWGYHVLCVDWDLEAPGLDRYLEAAGASEQPGLIDFVEALMARDGDPDWRHYVQSLDAKVGDRISLMTAGRMDEHYPARVQRLSWSALYEEHGFGEVVERLRGEWKAAFDFVLIDSRTGLTDIGGICTVQAPDVVVALLTCNQQSLDGLMGVLSRIEKSRDALPYDRGRLAVLPVVTRLEATVEVERTREWVDRIAEAMTPYIDVWCNKETLAEDLMTHLRIPHVARWSFGEEMPVWRENTSDPLSVAYAFETLAALIAHRLHESEKLISNRQSYVDAAALSGRLSEEHFEFDVGVVYQQSEIEFAERLADGLERTGLRVSSERSDLASPSAYERLAHSRNLVAVLGQQPTRWAEEDYRQFVIRNLRAQYPGIVVPVLLRDSDAVMPPSLDGFWPVEAFERDEETVIAEVALRIHDHAAKRNRRIFGPDSRRTRHAKARVIRLMLRRAWSERSGKLDSLRDQLRTLVGDDRPLIEELWTDMCRELGSGSVPALLLQEELAAVLRRAGRIDEAVSAQEDALQGLFALLRPNDPLVIGAEERLTELAEAVGDVDRARALKNRARSRREGFN